MVSILSRDKDNLWNSAVYRDYQDLNSTYYKRKLSLAFSEDYCKNLKRIHGGRVLVFNSINSFLDVSNEVKIGIDHCCYLDNNNRVYDPFLGYYDIDLNSYLNYIGAYVGNSCEFKII